MKKNVIVALVFLLIGLALGYLLFSVIDKSGSASSELPTYKSKDSQLTAAALSAAELIRDGSFDKLAETIHPVDGVYFVPYSYVDKESNQHFTAEQVASFGSDEGSYLWGYTDGEGAPIELTPKQYFEKFVYDEDYLTAPVINRNYISMSGNSIENVAEAFPDCEFVDFHFPGFDEQYAGMDWTTLRLVFREYEGTYKLVAVIHAQWTI